MQRLSWYQEELKSSMAAQVIAGHLGKINNFLFVVVLAIFAFFVHGVSEDDADGLLVIEGDSVTLHTGFKIDQQYRIHWFLKKIRIAQILVNSSKNCTDVKCNKDNEGFRDRLKLDYQTGSLTIINISHTDVGDYHLKIFSNDTAQEKVFKIQGVSAAVVKRKPVHEGESVTLDTLIKINTTDSVKWYFNDSVIAGISRNGELSSRDRLKLDNLTGTMNIMNIRTTDSGNYHLEISNNKFTVLRTFSVNVTASEAKTDNKLLWLVLVLVPIAAAVAYGLDFQHYRTNDKEKNKNLILDKVGVGDGKTSKPHACHVSELKTKLLNKVIGENQKQ